MSRRWPAGRTHEEEQPSSPEFTRLFVLGMLIAIVLGVFSGLGWMAYLFLSRQFGG